METTLHSSSYLHLHIIPSLATSHQFKTPGVAFRVANFSPKTSLSCTASSSSRGALCSAGDRQQQINSSESQFVYGKAIQEQIIEAGLSVAEKEIGDKCRCGDCQAKGAVLCTTCSGSGLYVDSILESQGIIVKVRCLSCGGTGNIMCSDCGGRGHL